MVGGKGIAVAAAAVSALTLLVALAACGGEGGRPSAGEAATTVSAGTSTRPLAAGHERLEAGAHVLDLTARAPEGSGAARLPRIEITLPEGWFNFDGWAVHKGPKPNSVFVTFWDVDEVYPTPCKWKRKPMIDPGPGVDGLASALARQPLRNATPPTDVVLGGVRGKYLQWSVPSEIAFDGDGLDLALFPDCDENTFQS